jgi:hypothetical protein
MIIVDSSVWIDFFNGRDTPQTSKLDALLSGEPIGVGDLILTEVLQGFRSDTDHHTARKLLTALPVMEMLGVERALKAAANFRALRKRGITIRKTADVIIATFCIEEGHSLLFCDQDFPPFVEHLGLRAVPVATS